MWPDKELEYIKLADDPIGIHYGLFDREQLAMQGQRQSNFTLDLASLNKEKYFDVTEQHM